MRERKEFQTEKEEVPRKTGRKSLLAQKFCTVQQRFSDQYEKVTEKEGFPFDLAMKPSSDRAEDKSVSDYETAFTVSGESVLSTSKENKTKRIYETIFRIGRNQEWT